MKRAKIKNNKRYYEAPGMFVTEFEAWSQDVIDSTVNMLENRYGVKLRKITKQEYNKLLPEYQNKAI